MGKFIVLMSRDIQYAFLLQFPDAHRGYQEIFINLYKKDDFLSDVKQELQFQQLLPSWQTLQSRRVKQANETCPGNVHLDKMHEIVGFWTFPKFETFQKFEKLEVYINTHLEDRKSCDMYW